MSTAAWTTTYVLNDYFQYDFGDYRSGSLSYSLPQLPVGRHKLLFRAWDVMNNSSTAELEFNVVKGLEPSIFSIDCTKNPAKTETTFIVTHDRNQRRPPALHGRLPLPRLLSSDGSTQV